MLAINEHAISKILGHFNCSSLQIVYMTLNTIKGIVKLPNIITISDREDFWA